MTVVYDFWTELTNTVFSMITLCPKNTTLQSELTQKRGGRARSLRCVATCHHAQMLAKNKSSRKSGHRVLELMPCESKCIAMMMTRDARESFGDRDLHEGDASGVVSPKRGAIIPRGFARFWSVSG